MELTPIELMWKWNFKILLFIVSRYADGLLKCIYQLKKLIKVK